MMQYIHWLKKRHGKFKVLKMENHLPCTDYESDERLLNVLIHYVEERNMPLSVAKEIMKHNLRESNVFDCMWIRFNNSINNKQWKVG